MRHVDTDTHLRGVLCSAEPGKVLTSDPCRYVMTHLETSVKRRQLSLVERGSTGAHAATVALMQECQNISQKMSSQEIREIAECPAVTASAQRGSRRSSLPPYVWRYVGCMLARDVE